MCLYFAVFTLKINMFCSSWSLSSNTENFKSQLSNIKALQRSFSNWINSYNIWSILFQSILVNQPAVTSVNLYFYIFLSICWIICSLLDIITSKFFSWNNNKKKLFLLFSIRQYPISCTFQDSDCFLQQLWQL